MDNSNLETALIYNQLESPPEEIDAGALAWCERLGTHLGIERIRAKRYARVSCVGASERPRPCWDYRCTHCGSVLEYRFPKGVG